MKYDLLIRHIKPFEIDSDRSQTFDYLHTLGVPGEYLSFLEATNGGYLQRRASWYAKYNKATVYLSGFLGVQSIFAVNDVVNVSKCIATANGHSELRFVIVSFSDVFQHVAFDLEKINNSGSCDAGLVLLRREFETITSCIDLDWGFMSFISRITREPDPDWENEPEDFVVVRLNMVEEFPRCIRDANAEFDGVTLRNHALTFSNEQAIDALADTCSFIFNEKDLLFAIRMDNFRAARALVRRGIKLPTIDYFLKQAKENFMGESQLIGALSLYTGKEIRENLNAMKRLSSLKGFWFAMDRKLKLEANGASSEGN
jgi:hypothetical protein